MFQLTSEQKKIIACDLRPGEILKIKAFAGTGKTTTLVEYAKARPRMRFLYIAFNKSVQLEAAQKFPPNVTARTSHALGFREKGYKYKERLVPGFRANQVMEALNLSSYEDARFAMDTLYNYLVSADPKVTRRHIPAKAMAFYDNRMPDLVDLANRLGRLMCDGSDETIGMLHDGYLKLYQLSNPVLHYDCILLDEAQDINPVTSAIVFSQAGTAPAPPGRNRPPAAIILVGDGNQQIYSFRGARDTLNHLQASHTQYLTQSFRFDNNIARVANMVLRKFKGEKRKIVGTPVRREQKPKWNPGRYTIIARTNAGVFDRAVQLFPKHKIGFVGGVSGYRLTLLKDVYHLFNGASDKVKDPYIRSFDDFTALRSYARAVEDLELMSLCAMVEKYTSRIPSLVDRITDRAVAIEDAGIILTTAHKSKGLEWANVLLMDDFHPLVEKGEIINPSGVEPDEFNLIYVAMTRAMVNLRFSRESCIPEFIKLWRKQQKKTLR
ncbi:MAG: ATP-dependent helicase [Desulfobacteraceae bacterium]|nr:ATP-dependent helicase [Desulfobacteraceae bacterium]